MSEYNKGLQTPKKDEIKLTFIYHPESLPGSAENFKSRTELERHVVLVNPSQIHGNMQGETMDGGSIFLGY